MRIIKTVIKYLKPRIFHLILAFVLICVTVAADLSLPNLMSNIISVGIQQSGIDSASPDAITENGYKLIEIFMTDEEKQTLENSYTLHEASESDSTSDKYSKLKSENVYVKKELSTEESEALDNAFTNADLTFYATAQSMASQYGSSAASSDSSSSSSTSIDLEQLYPMMSQLEKIPQSQITATRDKALSDYSSLSSSISVVFTKAFLKDAGADIDSIQMGYIIFNGLMMLGLTLCSVLGSIFVSLLISRTAAQLAKNVRHDVFSKVMGFSNKEFDDFSTASLITRTTNDITQVQLFFTMGIIFMLKAPLTGIGGTIMALSKSVSMAWTIALSVIILLGLIVVVFIVAMPKFKILQTLIDKVNLVSRENLNGIMVIRAFNNEEFEKDRYDQANTNLARTQLFVNRVMVSMMPAMMLIMNLSSLLIVWIGAHQIADSTMQIGDMMAFMQYSIQIIMAFLMIAMMFIMVPRATVSAKRIEEVLKAEESIKDIRKRRRDHFDPALKGRVEFKDVSFRFAGADDDTIQNISFVAEPGKTTAFIGSTGSGKSTLINLIPRFYDCTSGHVYLDGADVSRVGQHELRERIGYVPQKGVLHKGTIESNIAYGKEGASKEEILAAAEVAQAMDFISKKEDGFQSEIAAGGGNVSGGQKQRISIARALVRKPEVYIFDDSFSALDFKTDAALRHALASYTDGATVLIVAQRVGTIINADQIIVLDEGKIVGKGTHRELLRTCPVYYEIASSQLTKEELE